MRKIKLWLWHKFLPTYAKENLLEENERLCKALAESKQIIAEKDAYIAGLKAAMRAGRRITINNGVE